MKKIKVRYNHNCDDNHLFWRVLVDGNETLSSNVIFEVPTYTTKDYVLDSKTGLEVIKHHITCDCEEIIWKGDVVILK